jgi:uncharacterized protein
MIDMHVHAVSPQLPGCKPVSELLHGPPGPVADALRAEMEAAGVTRLLGMGHLGGAEDDALGIDSTLAVAELLPALAPIGVADPARTDADHLQRVEAQLQLGRVKALKAYLGYVYYAPDHPNYVPYYELAARYNVPVIFHTGDTYSESAKVRYAHPLPVDDVAVDHRGVRFVMAHFGNPWLTDAAEVVYKNDNVWADLSGLLVGDSAYFAELRDCGALRKVAERVAAALEYTERYDRFVYGSDWPLAPMAEYRDLVRRIVPPAHHEAVFEANARELFGIE